MRTATELLYRIVAARGVRASTWYRAGEMAQEATTTLGPFVPLDSIWKIPFFLEPKPTVGELGEHVRF
jgi:hypothetical protein